MKLILVLFFCLGLNIPIILTAQEADQSISEFNLTGFGEKGKKSWELSGKSADIFDENVKLTDIVGKLYGKEEDITLTAQQGNFDKTKGNVHLEEDVVITTTKGAKLTTDTLDWDRDRHIVSTKDRVNIERDNIITQALGAVGQLDLKKVNLAKDVEVQINPTSSGPNKDPLKNKITITCDGPLEVDYENNVAIFYNNVKVDQTENQIYSDRMDVYFTRQDKNEPSESKDASSVMGGEISKIVAKGNVKIVRGENISYSDEAMYDAKDKKIVLKGMPRLIIYPKGELDASTGD